jgi:hypothetical protein
MGGSAAVGPYRISAETLQEIAWKRREDYARADPFPHAVFDDLFPERALLKILEEFPAPGAIDWQRFDSPNEKRLASTRETQLGDHTRHFQAIARQLRRGRLRRRGRKTSGKRGSIECCS